jgi:FkbM family methyltransferase
MNVEDCLLHSLNGVNAEIAIDIGANVGIWARPLAAVFSHVIAVEADDRAYAELCRDLPANVKAIHGAACNYTGEVTIYKRPSSEQTSLLAAHPIGAIGCADAPVQELAVVKAYTLDSLCPGGADFVKIDIEGAEVVVLSAASLELWGRTTFVVECHDTFDEVRDELGRLGKTVERVPHPCAAAHPGHCWAIARP